MTKSRFFVVLFLTVSSTSFYFHARPCFCINQAAQGFQPFILLKVFLSVFQIKSIVKPVRISSLAVLDNGFRLVQRLDEPGFRGGVRVVFPPQGQQGFGFPLGGAGKRPCARPGFPRRFFLAGPGTVPPKCLRRRVRPCRGSGSS